MHLTDSLKTGGAFSKLVTGIPVPNIALETVEHEGVSSDQVKLFHKSEPLLYHWQWSTN